MRKCLLFICALFCFLKVEATHNRAGEIVYRQISQRTYEVTVYTYTKIDAPADRCEIEISWGDGTTEFVSRINGDPMGSCQHWGEPLYNNIKKNIYRAIHVYSSLGTYKISMMDYNRNEGVKNIPNSVMVPFYIESYINVSNIENNSPLLLNPPTDFGCVYKPFTHNLGAYDVDGDSLSYKLVNCRGLEGRVLEDTYSPVFNLSEDKIKIDKNGTIVWDSPIIIGQYNIAIEITEYRRQKNGSYMAIGKILRDMQIDITDCLNDAPSIDSEDDFCITANQTLSFDVYADDINSDNVSLTAVGGPFQLFPAPVFDTKNNTPVPFFANFSWTPDCMAAREAPYQITFKANDHPKDKWGNPLTGLSTQKIVNIKVLLPFVENLTSEILNDKIKLSWDKISCSGNLTYDVYQIIRDADFLDYCLGGLPSSGEYRFLANVSSNEFFINDISGFQKDIALCFFVIAKKDNLQSKPSIPTCIVIESNSILIREASILETHINNGESSLKWVLPKDFDVSEHNTPLTFKILYDKNLFFDKPEHIISQIDFDAEKTQIHTDINSLENIHFYKIKLFSEDNLVLESQNFKTPFLSGTPSNKSVLLSVDLSYSPWRTDSIQYFIKKDDVFQKIGSSKLALPFKSKNLENGKNYTFKALVFGSYDLNIPDLDIKNFTQEIEIVPEDNSVECPPEFYIENNDCSDLPLKIKIKSPSKICEEENIVAFLIFQKNESGDEFEQIARIEDTLWVVPSEFRKGFIIIKAEDLAGNISDFSNVVEIKKCSVVFLPNIFTPNGDGKADLFVPLKPIENGDFTITIYNRWGVKVFFTDNKKIEWNGKNTQGADCLEGVYFYKYKLINVNEQTLQGSGFVHLFR